MTSPSRAIILLSGGMDSITAGAVAKRDGFELYALSFSYGQRHTIELKAASRCAEFLGCKEHQVVSFDLRSWGGSALTSEMDVPKDRDLVTVSKEIPTTYVPARNTIFLSFALAWAEVVGAFDIFIGANAIDYSGYPDCRPEYLRSFAATANLATKAAIQGSGRFTVHAPLLHLSKVQIIEQGEELGVDYGLTHSCYDPGADGLACGHCDACRLRLAAFQKLNREDPVHYAS